MINIIINNNKNNTTTTQRITPKERKLEEHDYSSSFFSMYFTDIFKFEFEK